MVAHMHSCCSGCSQVASYLREALSLLNVSSQVKQEGFPIGVPHPKHRA